MRTAFFISCAFWIVIAWAFAATAPVMFGNSGLWGTAVALLGLPLWGWLAYQALERA